MKFVDYFERAEVREQNTKWRAIACARTAGRSGRGRQGCYYTGRQYASRGGNYQLQGRGGYQHYQQSRGGNYQMQGREGYQFYQQSHDRNTNRYQPNPQSSHNYYQEEWTSGRFSRVVVDMIDLITYHMMAMSSSINK